MLLITQTSRFKWCCIFLCVQVWISSTSSWAHLTLRTQITALHGLRQLTDLQTQTCFINLHTVFSYHVNMFILRLEQIHFRHEWCVKTKTSQVDGVICQPCDDDDDDHHHRLQTVVCVILHSCQPGSCCQCHSVISGPSWQFSGHAVSILNCCFLLWSTHSTWYNRGFSLRQDIPV